MSIDVIAARVAEAHRCVATARSWLVTARDVPWVAAAADAYRASLDAEQAILARLLRALDDLLDEASALGAAVPAGGSPAVPGSATAACLGPSARSVRVGTGGFVSVDPEALAWAAERLSAAARGLDDAGASLVAAVWSRTTFLAAASGAARSDDPDTVLRAGIGQVLRGPASPHPAAARLAGLAAATRAAARVHGDGESAAQRAARGAGALLGWLAGSSPVVAQAAFRVVTPTVAGLTAGTWLAASVDPAVAEHLGPAGGATVRAGVADVAIATVAGVLRPWTGGPVAPTLRPVGDEAARLAGAVDELARPVRLVPVVDPPRLPPATGVADLLGLVERSDDRAGPDGSAAAPPGTVTVQRLDHADGTTSWVVAVPGTQTWTLGGDDPMDLATNLHAAGKVDDSVTAGVLGVLRAEGVGADEPVVLVGHSQGGMVALAVAAAATAAGSHRIGGVVTAGSPSVPRTVPASVPVVRLEHDEDLVPRADDGPTTVEPGVTAVRRSLGDVVPAHYVEEYRATAGLLDADVAAHPGSVPTVEAVTGALGRDGTTATTSQYQLVRDAPATVVGATKGGGW